MSFFGLLQSARLTACESSASGSGMSILDPATGIASKSSAKAWPMSCKLPNSTFSLPFPCFFMRNKAVLTISLPIATIPFCVWCLSAFSKVSHAVFKTPSAATKTSLIAGALRAAKSVLTASFPIPSMTLGLVRFTARHEHRTNGNVEALSLKSSWHKNVKYSWPMLTVMPPALLIASNNFTKGNPWPPPKFFANKAMLSKYSWQFGLAALTCATQEAQLGVPLLEATVKSSANDLIASISPQPCCTAASVFRPCANKCGSSGKLFSTSALMISQFHPFLTIVSKGLPHGVPLEAKSASKLRCPLHSFAKSACSVLVANKTHRQKLTRCELLTVKYLSLPVGFASKLLVEAKLSFFLTCSWLVISKHTLLLIFDRSGPTCKRLNPFACTSWGLTMSPPLLEGWISNASGATLWWKA